MDRGVADRRTERTEAVESWAQVHERILRGLIAIASRYPQDGDARADPLRSLFESVPAHQRKRLYDRLEPGAPTDDFAQYFKRNFPHTRPEALAVLRGDLAGFTSSAPAPRKPLPQNPVLSLGVETYVDNFKEVIYDPNYRVEEARSPTNWLYVVYDDGTEIDIHFSRIVDEPSLPVRDALAHMKLGDGNRAFPSEMSSRTTPRLWSAKQKALEDQATWTIELMKLAVVSAVMFIITMPPMPVGMPGRSASATSRRVRGSIVSRARPRATRLDTIRTTRATRPIPPPEPPPAPPTGPTEPNPQPPVDPDATPVPRATPGGKPIVRIDRPQVGLDVDQFRATWTGDPKAVVMFKEMGSGIELSFIDEGLQTGQGPKLLANALRRVAQVFAKPRLAKPAFIHSWQVVNRPLRELIEVGRMAEAQRAFRRLALIYARALGGRPGTVVLKKVGETIVARVTLIY